MSNSDVSVELRADNSLADILLLDGSFKVVARGPSPLKASVPAGLYAVKVKIGDEETEELVEFEPGRVPGLLALASMELELSELLGGRRVDLRTAEDLSRYFRDEVVRTAEVQYAR